MEIKGNIQIKSQNISGNLNTSRPNLNGGVSGITRAIANWGYIGGNINEQNDLISKLVNLANDIKNWVLQKGYSTFSGSYNDLTNKPFIPQKTSQIINDSEFTTKTYVDNHHDATKQDKINDLSTIRSGASKGATSVQPSQISDMATKTWTNQQGFLKQHQSLDNYYTKQQTDTKISNHHDTSKQDKLVSGQNIKTINGQSILGNGNIPIDSGASDWTEVENKPFETIGENLEVVNGQLNAIQPSLEGYATEQWVEDKGYLTEHQSLANYDTKEEVNTKIANHHDSTMATITYVDNLNEDNVHYSQDTNTYAQRQIARDNLKVRPYRDVIKTTTLQDIRYNASTIYNSTYRYCKFGEIKPTDYDKPCYVKLRYRGKTHNDEIINCFQDSTLEYYLVPQATSSSDDTINGYVVYFYNFDNVRTSLTCLQYFTIRGLTKQGYENEVSIPFGTTIYTGMYKYNTVSRDVQIDVLEIENCDVDLVESSNPTYCVAVANFLGDGEASDYNTVTDSADTTIGNKHTGDVNTTYSLNYFMDNNRVLASNEDATANNRKIYYYRFCVEREDGQVEGLTKTYSTAVKNLVREPNLHLRALFGGDITIYQSTTARDVGYLFATTLYLQNVGTTNLCYNVSSNASGTPIINGVALTNDDINKYIYLKAKMNDDGITWSLDPTLSETDISAHLTLDLPTTNDGYIYIRLCRMCNSLTNAMMVLKHPIYMHDGTSLKIIG